jgi:hypothetical protein
MAIVLNGSGTVTGITGITGTNATVTGITSVGSNSANTPVILNDSGSNSNTCRAWVNFNGIGTVAIRASFNVSSITDNAVSDFTVNLTNAMPDANYAIQLTCRNEVAGGETTINLYEAGSPSTSNFRMTAGRFGTGRVDSFIVCASVFR